MYEFVADCHTQNAYKHHEQTGHITKHEKFVAHFLNEKNFFYLNEKFVGLWGGGGLIEI